MKLLQNKLTDILQSYINDNLEKNITLKTHSLLLQLYKHKNYIVFQNGINTLFDIIVFEDSIQLDKIIKNKTGTLFNYTLLVCKDWNEYSLPNNSVFYLIKPYITDINYSKYNLVYIDEYLGV